MMIKTNFYGPKLMSEALIPLIDHSEGEGRIVNVGAIAAPMYVAKCDEQTKKFLSSQVLTWPELETYVKDATTKVDGFGAYGMSKAALSKYTEVCAKDNPNLKISCVTPGFIDTAICAGYGAKLTPE